MGTYRAVELLGWVTWAVIMIACMPHVWRGAKAEARIRRRANEAKADG